MYLMVDAHFQFYVGRQFPDPVFAMSLAGFGGGGVWGLFCSVFSFKNIFTTGCCRNKDMSEA